MSPVIRIAVGKQPTFNSLLADTIYCLTGRKPPSGEYFAGKMNLVSQQLYNQQIKLLIFDDVQHVSVDKTSRSTHAASEVFKVLAKVLNAEIVLAGLPDGTNAVVAANSQTIPLSINRVDIGPIEYPFVSDARFHGVMKEISKNMPFDKVSPIGSLEVAQRMHAYSGGVWGTVKQLLRAATMYALENKFDYVDQAILAKAVELGMMPTKAANPFIGPPPAPPILAQL